MVTRGVALFIAVALPTWLFLKQNKPTEKAAPEPPFVERAVNPPLPKTAPSPSASAPVHSPGEIAAIKRLAAERERLDATVWADERAAQRHERIFVELWDLLRSKYDRYAVLKQFPWIALTVPEIGDPSSASYGISIAHSIAPDKAWSREWSRDEFAGWLDKLKASGLELVQFEFHHGRFLPDKGQGARSLFNAEVHARKAATAERFILKGQLDITWQPDAATNAPPMPAHITATNLTLLTRKGPPAFKRVDLPPESLNIFYPIAAHDMNDDGLPEIILPGSNTILWNQGNMRFAATNLFSYRPEGVDMTRLGDENKWIKSVAADFTRDGLTDYLLAIPNHGVFLYTGDEQGHFPKGGVRLFKTTEEFLKVSTITCGDVNGDGWLDVWIGQYREPYVSGQMPTPFYDANDGFPSFLLLNREGKQFEDVTVAAGLGKKRFRRNLSASFFDLDDDGDLDLLTVNDFSGLDAFVNDGKGHFRDASTELFDERANFGMAHSIADFDNDGKLDVYVTGMSSTTVRRIISLGLGRDAYPDVDRMRMPMAYGNRMYIRQDKATYRQPAYRDQVARSGWTWGVSAFDFGNDGNLDMYLANGFMSGKSCQDYCTRYWTHDVYVQNSVTNPILDQVLKQDLNNHFSSWNGFEKNVLFLNGDGKNYFNAGYLMDVGFELDSRCVLAEDFDADGRVDLIFSTAEFKEAGKGGLKFQLLHNQWPENGNWIGVRLRGDRDTTPFGAKVTVRTDAREHVAAVVSGDSYFCQHSTTRHFGIGTAKAAREITVLWPDGRTTRLTNPAINRYHPVRPPVK